MRWLRHDKKAEAEQQRDHLIKAIQAERRAKEADQRADKQMERADDLATEAQRMRAANDFIATYLDLFAPKRRGNRIWPHG
jgi:hypothetical protein